MQTGTIVRYTAFAPLASFSVLSIHISLFVTFIYVLTHFNSVLLLLCHNYYNYNYYYFVVVVVIVIIISCHTLSSRYFS
jgi:hypothetical protein